MEVIKLETMDDVILWLDWLTHKGVKGLYEDG